MPHLPLKLLKLPPHQDSKDVLQAQVPNTQVDAPPPWAPRGHGYRETRAPATSQLLVHPHQPLRPDPPVAGVASQLLRAIAPQIPVNPQGILEALLQVIPMLQNGLSRLIEAVTEHVYARLIHIAIR